MFKIISQVLAASKLRGSSRSQFSSTWMITRRKRWEISMTFTEVATRGKSLESNPKRKYALKIIRMNYKTCIKLGIQGL
jgi:hypothetical protein